MPLVLKKIPAGTDRRQFGPSSGYKDTWAGQDAAKKTYERFRGISKAEWDKHGLRFDKPIVADYPIWILYWDDGPTINEFGEVAP